MLDARHGAASKECIQSLGAEHSGYLGLNSWSGKKEQQLLYVVMHHGGC